MVAMKKRTGLTPEEDAKGQRLRSIWDAKRKPLGLTQEKAGETLGMTQGAVGQYLNRRIPLGTNALLGFSRILEVDPREIDPAFHFPVSRGHGHAESPAEYVPSDFKSVDLMQARPIPVINYAQAGCLREFFDDYAPGAGIEQVFVDAELAEALSKHAFGLSIRGDSMEPDFSEGDIVIIDPSVAPLPGDYVVARDASSQAATFKRYRARGNDADGSERFELVPLNDDYATIMCDADNPCEIIGTMIEHRRRRRR